MGFAYLYERDAWEYDLVDGEYGLLLTDTLNQTIRCYIGECSQYSTQLKGVEGDQVSQSDYLEQPEVERRHQWQEQKLRKLYDQKTLRGLNGIAGSHLKRSR